MSDNADLSVLMFGWEFPPHISGGLGTACYGLTKAIKQLGGVRTTLLLPRRHADDDARHVAIRYPAEDVAGLPVEGTSAYCASLLPAASRFAESMAGMLAALPAPDVIHAHDWLTAPAALAARRVLNRPLVFHVHSTERDRCARTPDQAIRQIEASALAQADAVVAVSEHTRRQLIREYGVDPARIEVVYNGIDLPEAGPRRAARTDAPLICFLGRVTYQKGPAYFLRAAAIALEANPALRFVMAGDGDLLPAMRALAAGLGIADRVSFTGFLTAEEVAQLFRHAAVLVMPSISEPFGLVALEAAAAGVPVVISEHAGVTEILSQVVRIRPDDVHGIARAMLDVTSDEVLAQRLRVGGGNEIRAVSWRRAALHLQSIYHRLCRRDVLLPEGAMSPGGEAGSDRQRL
ncbi:glycosyltransferase family 4 protein [Duganella radicis]|uniref:Glycosyltransferase n=1 Tax=Duganella radicis TaxID=551988 RepID=A0A6L6PCN8_9BURK|nr:glycosyltransferase family 4 protein [Duganella radicis]MTV36643.1 glycosyltransferase [Duganella radicis]